MSAVEYFLCAGPSAFTLEQIIYNYIDLACEGKRGYRVSDPDDIGMVRLVGWLMRLSCSNSTYSFFLLLVCELGPVSIPKAKARGAVRDRQ